MSEFRKEQPASGEEPQLEGLLFTGDVIRSLTPEQLAAIGQTALSFSVEMKLVHDVEQDLSRMGMKALEKGKTEKDLAPVKRRDFVAFADRYGYPKMRAWKSWNTSVCLGEEYPQSFEDDTLPPVQLLVDREDEFGNRTLREHQVVDLRSIYARLKQSRLDAAYYGAPDTEVEFLAHLCNEVLQPDEPLPIEDI